ncbi:MAG: hypothetical protein LLG04_10885 [Parachlamydia sp.]|nr:hypothetical protein [Parachlamydia sp.]
MQAKIQAEMKMDGSNFRNGIDGAKDQIKSMDVSLRTLKKTASMAFGLGMMTNLIGAFKELRTYQEKTGQEIISENSLAQIDRATESIEKLKMTLIGYAAQGVSVFLQGIKTMAAGVGDLTVQIGALDKKAIGAAFLKKGLIGGILAARKGIRSEQIKQAMAEAITEGGSEKDRVSDKEWDEYQKKRAHEKLENARQLMTAQKKLVSLEKEKKELGDVMFRDAIAGAELTKTELAQLEKINAIEKEIASTKKTIADEVTRQRKEELAATEALEKAKAKLKSMDLRDATTLGKLKASLSESVQEMKDAEKAARSPELKGAEKIKAETRIVEAKTSVKINEDAIKKYWKDKAEKEKEISTKFTGKEQDILAGKDKNLTPLQTGLNALASIGGYVGTTKQAAGMAMKDRSLEVQERIRENTREMKEALDRIAGES